MESSIEYGISERGNPTAIYRNFEYWKVIVNGNDTTSWRCCKYRQLGCKARLLTNGTKVVGNRSPEHCHEGNIAKARARKAVGDMKTKMSEVCAIPSAVLGSVTSNLSQDVLMALPKKSTLQRALQRQRRKDTSRGDITLPPTPTDLLFDIPQQFTDFVLFDSGPGHDRLIILGSNTLLDGLARADMWLVDGTFKVVPLLFFQLYTIHFTFVPGIIPVGLYCLLPNKSGATYNRLLVEIKRLIPAANPQKILIDFESAAINAFSTAYSTAAITGCYFHLTQSVLRKVNELGMKEAYETDDVIRGAVRCLPALALVPETDVIEAFELLSKSMPAHQCMKDLITYFKHTYIRGKRLRGRGNNYGQARFPMGMWNQHDASVDGIARTTNAVEGWHYGLQALFQCHHPTMWTFLKGLLMDHTKQTALLLQGAAGALLVQEKRYRELSDRVRRAVEGYGRTDVLTFLRSIAYLSHS